MQKQLNEMRNMAAMLTEQAATPTAQEDSAGRSSSSPSGLPRPKMGDPDELRLEKLKSLLSELETKYKEKHPDILTTKKRICNWKKRLRGMSYERIRG